MSRLQIFKHPPLSFRSRFVQRTISVRGRSLESHSVWELVNPFRREWSYCHSLRRFHRLRSICPILKRDARLKIRRAHVPISLRTVDWKSAGPRGVCLVSDRALPEEVTEFPDSHAVALSQRVVRLTRASSRRSSLLPPSPAPCGTSQAGLLQRACELGRDVRIASSS